MSGALHLTAEQENAVTATGRPCLLVAPPGSGKTEVLVQRVMRLLTTGGNSTSQVLALTFTNKAAESLRARILDEVGDQDWRLFAGTFHSFCLDVLKNYGSRIAIPPTFSILEDDDARIDTLVRGLEAAAVRVGQVNRADFVAVLQRIDRLRADLVPAEDAPSGSAGPLGATTAVAYSAYTAQMTSDASIDFPGLLFDTYRLLSTDAWVLTHYRDTYEHIVVDEAQDLNGAQYGLLKLLCDNSRDVFLVADRFQSIYAFTGASPRYLDEFRRDFAVLDLQLTTNFRSAHLIVQLANNLAKHFASQTTRPVSMESSAGASGVVIAEQHPTEDAEARAVARWLLDLSASGLDPAWLHRGEDVRVSSEDCCVLARTRFALEPVARVLTEKGVGFALRTGDRALFDSRLGQITYYSLRLIANPADVSTRRRVQSLAGLTQQSTTSDEPILEFISRLNDTALPTAVVSTLGALAAGRQSPDDVITYLSKAELPGLDTPDNDEAAQWGDDQDRLGDLWRRYIIQTAPHSRTIDGFMRYIVQVQRTVMDEPGIRLLTVHTAKGLEFKAVALVGMNDGTFPHYLSVRSDEELDEERRNAYVAITRAARALYLSRAAVRATRYGPRADPPSRFLDEMGAHLTPATPF